MFLSVVSVSLWGVCLFYAVETSNNFFFIPLTILSYISFTPMHEASHGAVAGSNSKFKFLERIVGFVSAITLFVPYPVFRVLHLRHHSFTNDPDKDPDFWIATRNPLVLVIKSLTMKGSYYDHILFKPTEAMKSEMFSIVYSLGTYAAVIFYVEENYGKGFELFKFWLGSSLLSIAFLAIVFDWLPHYPYNSTERYHNTKIINKPFLNYILLFQNYHLVHHLYPKIPFYLYGKVFFDIRKELEEKGSPIVD